MWMIVDFMAVKDEHLALVRNALAESNPECRVIVAPSFVGIYVNKCKDALTRSELCPHWKFRHRGLLALVYHPSFDLLKLVVADARSGRSLWQEAYGAYTDYQAVHDVFHVLNSARNFCQKIGVFYGDERVARMVCDTLDAFSAQHRRQQMRRGKGNAKNCIVRSRSFNAGERVRVDVKLKRSYSNSMGDVKLQRTALSMLEQEAKRYVAKRSRKSSFRRILHGLRSSFRVKARRQESSADNDTLRTKRSRLSAADTDDDDETDACCRVADTQADAKANELSANWKLSDVELEQLYRLSFFNEHNTSSTDLCTTDL